MSRTAALSRYLAALDGPIPFDESKSNSNEGSSSTPMVPTELKPCMTMDDEVCSGRHKVVVAPSSLGMSVRDMVSSRNRLPDGRPRSRSAGRAPMRSSRDIVQDIYSRMGVDYTAGATSQRSREATSGERSGRSHAPQRTRSGEAPVQEQQQPTGTPSSGVNNADTFHERYRAAAALSVSRSGTPERRSRSLGRGWPPGRAVQTAGESASTTAPAADVQHLSASDLLNGTNSNKRVEPGSTSSVRNDARTAGLNTGHGNFVGNGAVIHPSWKKSSSVPSNTNQSLETVDKQEDKTESSDSAEKDGMRDEMPPPGSVKDRLSAFSVSAKTKNSRNFPRTYPSHYSSKRDHPPKIDIYEEIRRAEEAESSLQQVDGTEQDASAGPTPDASNLQPYAAGDNTGLRTNGNSKSVSAYNAKSHSVSSVKTPSSPRSTKNSSSNVAGAFLAAIHSSQPSVTSKSKKAYIDAPVTEVTADESGAHIDSTSVLSGLSGDEFVQSPRAGQRDSGVATKSRPSWSERNKLATYQKMNSAGNVARNGQVGTGTVKSTDVDRIVDERVQAQVRALETSMNARFTAMESKLEERLKSHMEYMEAKFDARMDEIMSMIFNKLKDVGKHVPSSPGRQEI